MDRMAASHLKTLVFLEEGKIKEAMLEYRMRYLASVKKLYAEAGSTYPLRFSKAEHWCVWTKKLYVLSRRTEETLKAGDTKKATGLLEDLRGHFYALHKETKTFHCNDLLYQFRTEAAKKEPSAEKLRAMVKHLEKTEPSWIIKKKAKEYAEAKGRWKEAIAPLLEDGQIDSSEHASLRKATEAFYRAFGIQYE